MKKILIYSILVLFMVPAIANAAWWNPISWFSFFWSKPVVVEKVVYIQATSSADVATTSSNTSLNTQENVQSVQSTDTKRVVTQSVKQTPTAPQTVQPQKVNQNLPTMSSQNAVQVSPQPTAQTINVNQENVSYIAKYKSLLGEVEQTQKDHNLYVGNISGPALGEAETLSYLDQKLQSAISNMYAEKPTPDLMTYYGKLLNDLSTQYNQLPLHALTDVERQQQQEADNAAAQQSQIDAQNTKKAQLNSINQQIASLNAKYANDLEKVKTQSGGTTASVNAEIQQINSQYTIDYDKLQAEWQAIYYGN